LLGFHHHPRSALIGFPHPSFYLELAQRRSFSDALVRDRLSLGAHFGFLSQQRSASLQLPHHPSFDLALAQRPSFSLALAPRPSSSSSSSLALARDRLCLGAHSEFLSQQHSALLVPHHPPVL